MKPAVLIFPFELLAHYSRCIQVAETIKNDYDVRFVCSRRYADLLRRAGFETFECATFDADAVMAEAAKFRFGWLNDGDIERVFRSQCRVIEQYRPVAVLGDTAPTLKMAAEFLRVPHVALMNGYVSKYYRIIHAIPRNHIAANFQPFLPAALMNRLVTVRERGAMEKVHRPFQRLRARYHLNHLSMYLDELEGDSNLICDLPELFPLRPLPDNYSVIGPLYYSSPQPEPELRRLLDNGKQTILLNIGSSGDAGHFRFVDEPYFHRFNIVAGGVPTDLFNGDHIIARPFINNNAIYDLVDLVICHGGNGTIYQALSHGMPLLCVPGNFEQEWNVQQVVALGLGASLAGITDIQKICRLVEEWMEMAGTPVLQTFKEKCSVAGSRDRFRNFWYKTFPRDEAAATWAGTLL